MEDILIIRKTDFETKTELLDHIAAALDFPPHFGRNLDALFDCLCDLEQRINIALDPLPAGDESSMASDGTGWYDDVCHTVFDAALENENIRVFRVRHMQR